MSWLTDIVDRLEDQGVGTFGVDIFASSTSSIPILSSGAATIQVVATGGTTPDYTHNQPTRPAFLNPAAQLTTRAGTYAEAEAKARDAYFALCIRNMRLAVGNGVGVLSSGTFYRWIKPLQEPFDTGVDPRGQATVKFNVIGSKVPTVE